MAISALVELIYYKYASEHFNTVGNGYYLHQPTRRSLDVDIGLIELDGLFTGQRTEHIQVTAIDDLDCL